jgi:hypothetical protein
MPDILNQGQINSFIQDGFVRIDNAFPRHVAEAALDILWDDLPCDRNDPATWTSPVIRLGMYTQKPFIDAVNSPRLHTIFNQLVGEGRWLPCGSVGTFPVRFPASDDPGDTGWHVDAGFPGSDPNNFFEWRVNVSSKGRALLMLVLFSNVSEADAPTVISRGSHLDVARLLYPYGDKGLSFMEIATSLASQPQREQVNAVGGAGTIYLCHPFLAHAAQLHSGTTPKFMAQPPLLLKGAFDITSKTAASPVEQAIKLVVDGLR